jgi:hypothetical protein
VVGFVVGTLFGASVLGFLIFGPWDIGQFKSTSPSFAMTPAPTIPQPIDESESVVTTNENVMSALPVEAQAKAEGTPTEAQVEPIAIPSEVSLEVVGVGLETGAAVVATESLTTESARQLMAITASILNVRAQPTVDSAIVIKLGEGARVWAYPDESVGMWMKISVEGEIGYASSRFMRAIQ